MKDYDLIRPCFARRKLIVTCIFKQMIEHSPKFKRGDKKSGSVKKMLP